MSARMCRCVVGLLLGLLTEGAPAFAQAAAQPQAADPMAQSVERARDARERWLDTARTTSPFQPKGDQRWPPPPTPLPGGDLFRATPETYAPRDTPYRPSVVASSLPTGPSYRRSPVYEPYVPATHTQVTGFGSAPRWRDWEPPRPGNVDVFVDGKLFGTVDSVSRQGGLHLRPGFHRVDLRAVGFGSAAYNVTVRPPHYFKPVYDSGLYVPLVPVSASPSYGYAPYGSWPLSSFGAPPHPYTAPRSVYVVPRCYAGDEPPKDYQLPTGCSAPKR
jgi:hypothetical protein